MMKAVRLGVNIDHIATVRQQRHAIYPNLIDAAQIAIKNGADGITVHLREDRRHIQDADLLPLRTVVPYLNLEMAATDEMLEIATRIKPNACCLVPEKRHELTTEGGLDVVLGQANLTRMTQALKAEGIAVSYFVDPAPEQIFASALCGADIVELHTGDYAALTGSFQDQALFRLIQAADLAHENGLRVHAGHGLDYHSVQGILTLPHLEELNIGFSIISRALFVGLSTAVMEMNALIKSSFLD